MERTVKYPAPTGTFVVTPVVLPARVRKRPTGRQRSVIASAATLRSDIDAPLPHRLTTLMRAECVSGRGPPGHRVSTKGHGRVSRSATRARHRFG